MNLRQRTISRQITLDGAGLFSGEPASMTILPAEPDSGVTFLREQGDYTARIPALVQNVLHRPRRTCLRNGSLHVEMIEHCMAALSGMGISNAMLMSVTERFREIGTMKCLGALDSFVVKLFLIESTMQGFLGTLLGVILGLCLALTKVLYDYGWTSFGFIPWSLLGLSVLLSLVCGTGLAVGGALYPAYVAAKMEPAVAMRVDQ